MTIFLNLVIPTAALRAQSTAANLDRLAFKVSDNHMHGLLSARPRDDAVEIPLLLKELEALRKSLHRSREGAAETDPEDDLLQQLSTVQVLGMLNVISAMAARDPQVDQARQFVLESDEAYDKLLKNNLNLDLDGRFGFASNHSRILGLVSLELEKDLSQKRTRYEKQCLDRGTYANHQAAIPENFVDVEIKLFHQQILFQLAINGHYSENENERRKVREEAFEFVECLADVFNRFQKAENAYMESRQPLEMLAYFGLDRLDIDRDKSYTLKELRLLKQSFELRYPAKALQAVIAVFDLMEANARKDEPLLNSAVLSKARFATNGDYPKKIGEFMFPFVFFSEEKGFSRKDFLESESEESMPPMSVGATMKRYIEGLTLTD